MRTAIEQVTCDDCGQMFSFEKTNVDVDRARTRIESLTDWLREHGWLCEPVIGSSLRIRDTCPACMSRPGRKGNMQ